MRRLVTGILLLIAVGALTTYLIGRPVIEGILSRKIETRAARSGLDLQWGPMAMRGWGVSIPDIRMHRGRLRASVEQIDVNGALHALVTDNNWVESIRVSGLRVIYDLTSAGVSGSARTRTADGKIGTGVPSSPFPKMDIEAFRGDILLPDGRGRLTVTSALFQIRQISDRLQFGGEVELGHSYGFTVLGKLSGSLDYANRRLRFELKAPSDTAPLVALRLGKLRFELQRLEGSADTNGYRVTAHGLRLRHELRGGLEAPKISLIKQKADVRIVAEGGELTMKRRRASMPSDGSNGRTRSSVPFLFVPGAVQRVFEQGMVLEWTDLNLELPTIPRLLKTHVIVRDQRLDAEALIGGGRFKIEGDWTDGWTQPIRASVALVGFQLAPLFAGRLPALPPGRTRHQKLDGDVNLSLEILAVPGSNLVGQLPNMIFQLGFGWKGGRVDISSISPDPLTRIDISGKAEGLWTTYADTLQMSGDMHMGAIRLDGKFALTDVRTTPKLMVKIDGAEMPCQAAFSSLPEGVLGPYSRLKVSGRFKPYVRFKFPFQKPGDLTLKFGGFIQSCEIDALNAENDDEIPATAHTGGRLDLSDVDWLNSDFKYAVREGVVGDEEIFVGPGVTDYVPIEELPAYVGGAAYLSEEINFYKNRPIDPGLIGRAMKLNMRKRRFVYGGSTVTQQLVKNLFLVRAKSLARKVREIVIAKRITQQIQRSRVLELYLNCIEFGPNIFGIQAASRHYFQKDARTLTPLEAVFLAMLKPAPSWGGWIVRRGETPSMPYWSFRTEQILQRLVKAQYLTQEDADAQRPYTLYWTDGQYQDRNKPAIVPATP